MSRPRSAAAPLAATLAFLSPAALAGPPAHPPADTATPVSPRALESLVDTERAFARAGVAKGVRASFLEFFADDGIWFQPHPTNTREALLKRPPASPPFPITLSWEPLYADVSRAADLGYTTGPFTVTDNTPAHKPTRHGYFFSIWRKQPDGSWKVALDAGVETPGKPQEAAFHTATVSAGAAPAGATVDGERESLLAQEARLSETAAKEGPLAALRPVLHPDVRVHREGRFPARGVEAAEKAFAGGPPVRYTPIRAEVAASFDLGTVYGGLKPNGRDGSEETGYFVRVWKRDAAGAWKVVFDTELPVPPAKK